MDSKDLQPGKVYRLSRDVENPSPDRRGRNLKRGWSYSNYEWASKMEVWKKGMRFRYVVRDRGIDEKKYESAHIENFDGDLHGEIEPEIWNPKWTGPSDTKHEKFLPNPKWVALVEALEPEPENFDTFMCDVSDASDCGANHAYDLLSILLERGQVTKENIRGAWAELERRWQDEE
jgi:hypothetical protein